MNSSLIILSVAMLIATSCSLLGVFLLLKNMSMLTDAISHTILLGIVIAFLISHNQKSYLMIIFATIVGLLTVYLVETLVKTKLMKEDSAIGIVLSFLFSIAVLLISKYAADIHLDIDTVLLGELAFAPFYIKKIFNIAIPQGIFYGIIMLTINTLFIKVFLKELKLSIFDRVFAQTIGFLPTLVHYALMTLVSFTSVLSFDSIGSILLVSFMIGPALSSYLIAKNLKEMILYSIIIGNISVLIGYYIALYFDISISGMISIVIGIIFLGIYTFKNMMKI